MKKYFAFDPLKSFVSLPIVWVAVAILTIAAIVVLVDITLSSEIQWQKGYQGVNFIFEVYKLPLTLLALIIPIIALLAANHRSEQTKAQLLAVNEQNIFANYYKHVEEFEKYLSSHVSDSRSIIENKRKLHNALFPDAYKGSYALSENIFELLDDGGVYLVTLFKCFEGGHHKTQSDTIIEIELQTRKLEQSIGVRWTTGGKTFIHNGIEVNIERGELSGYLSAIVKRIEVIDIAASFDRTYISAISIRQILNTNLKAVPEHDIVDNTQNASSFELIRN